MLLSALEVLERGKEERLALGAKRFRGAGVGVALAGVKQRAREPHPLADALLAAARRGLPLTSLAIRRGR